MSVLTKTDWNLEWQQAAGGERTPDTAAFWNAKAARCRRTGQFSPYSNDPYIGSFLEYAALRPHESVLDIGCGPGTLAVPLARAGHSVTAVDFSAVMLALLIQESHAAGGLDITPLLADWRDDWGMKGIEQADVLIASRSVAAADLEQAIIKANRWARRRACISTAACGSPWFDRTLFKALGRHICQHAAFAYCMNILFAMDMRPELRFIDSPKHEVWATRAEAVAALRRSCSPVSLKEELRFERFCKQHLVRLERTELRSTLGRGFDTEGAEDAEAVWTRDYERVVEWAFIAWDKPQ